MSSILIVYGSKYGQTERVAHRIGGILMGADHQVTIYKGDRLPTEFTMAAYDSVVVAAPVIMNHHQTYIRDFVRRHVHRLNEVRSAFVSVCGAGGDPPRAQAYVDALLAETGWRPMVTRFFTGAVAYTRYAWPFRWALKLISRGKGLPTDTSRDWDFTEWDKVEAFAKELSVMLAPMPAEHPLSAWVGHLVLPRDSTSRPSS